MTDTKHHHNPIERRAWSHINEHLRAQARQIRAGQGTLLLFSQFPGHNPANHRGYMPPRPKT